MSYVAAQVKDGLVDLIVKYQEMKDGQSWYEFASDYAYSRTQGLIGGGIDAKATSGEATLKWVAYFFLYKFGWHWWFDKDDSGMRCKRQNRLPGTAAEADWKTQLEPFLKKSAARMGKPVAEISAETLNILKAYDFPGNVRELENIIERGVAIATGDIVETAYLPDDLRELTIRTFRKKDGRLPSLEEQERDYIRWVLQDAGGNQTLAAQILGIDRVSLWRKLKRYQLDML